MKSERILKSLGQVDDRYVQEAAPGQGRRKRRFYQKTPFRAAAAVLAVIILCLAVFGPLGKMSKVNAHAIAQAEYPQMAPYPNETKYYGITGNFDDEGFSKAYNAWWEDKKKQWQQEEGYREGLDIFFKESSRQFLSEAGGENRVYSPLNVFMALGMLAELTEGSSRQQILDAVGAENMDALRKQAAAVWNANYCDDGAVTSILANSVWLSDGISYRQDTMDLLAKNYYASSFQGEMGSAEYDEALREWLNEQTGGLLKEQASNVGMDSDTMLALVSTVLFRAKWQNEFLKSNTQQGIFHAQQGDESCDFMYQSDSQTYYWGDKFAAVSKKLQESGSMWFLLPDEGISVDELLADEETMDFICSRSEVKNEWEKSRWLIVHLAVPKFDAASETDLTSCLKALGIMDAFDGSVSDFSPMSEAAENVYISKAEHAARVMIDEEGCTAAAYTAMMEAGAAAPPDEEVDFVLDRPFLFVITGNDGLPMFVGVVNHAV